MVTVVKSWNVKEGDVNAHFSGKCSSGEYKHWFHCQTVVEITTPSCGEIVMKKVTNFLLLLSSHVSPVQYSLSVLSRSRSSPLPLRLAAHLHPSAALSHARHRLHSNAVHRRPPVQFSAPAERAPPRGGQRG